MIETYEETSVGKPSRDFRQVPSDLLGDVDRMQRFHALKSSAVVRCCIPLSRILTAPQAAKPGILMYHRVVPTSRHCQPTWNVTPDRFRAQLSGLLKRGYVAWSLSQLVEASASQESIPDNVFVVTFDDGYANNLIHALPILEELNVPATIFLATSYLGSKDPFPFDDWKQKGNVDVDPDTWRALTLDETYQLLDSNLIELGSHTHTHEDFRNRPEAFRDSLSNSIDVLEREFGILNPTLSLPYGIVERGFAGPTYFATARSLGTTCCLTTEEETVNPQDSPFGWGRFIAEQHDSADTLAVKLDGWRDTVRDRYRRLRGKPV